MEKGETKGVRVSYVMKKQRKQNEQNLKAEVKIHENKNDISE